MKWAYHFMLHFLIHASESSHIVINNQGLTQFPANITFDVNDLDLSDNLIASFILPASYTQIWRVKLDTNRLTEFPDVRASYSNLIHLNLHRNLITHIDPQRLDGLSNLQFLSLGWNKLSQFPDVAGPSNSMDTLKLYVNQFQVLPIFKNLGKHLKEIRFESNQMRDIPREFFEVLSHGTMVKLGSDFVQNIPNMCHFPIQISFTQLKSLVCDCHIRWTTLKEGGLRQVISDESVCQADAIPMDLQCTGNMRSMHITPITSDFSCLYPPVVLETSQGSVIECSIRCMQHLKCIVFAFDETEATNPNCLLTDVEGVLTSTKPAHPPGNFKWYTID
ncbi:hypothetical protein CAPTEDRAFT_200355 [Capitella teleta]|uniref:Apple domain-containing protein n=1 Tax=Capitella teleta TaxID=283909 RepID=R7V1B7_CAPTE|nr:hypothetical protein CAPTEDRAFT_200355 [Capitella teleta]|eukprot:ELU09486.1 hypothetical protein CAPTEDRAFT_200355 [Capitella teleta]